MISKLVILAMLLLSACAQKGELTLKGFEIEIVMPQNFDLSIEIDSNQQPITNSLPIEYLVTFDTSIIASSFQTSAISNLGTAEVDSWTITPIDAENFILSATSVSTDGTILPSISASAIRGANGATNNGFDLILTPVIYDSTPPEISISSDLTVNVATAPDVLLVEENEIELLWSKVSGGGSITFAGGDDILEPIISATANDQYVLRLTATDAAGNSSSEDFNFVWDQAGPSISGVSFVTSDGSYGPLNDIDIAVTFSDVVTVVGSPRILLETGTTDRYAVYNSGTTTDTLVFRYTIQTGDISSDLDFIATNSLALNGGTIKDAFATDAILTLPAVGTLASAHAVVIDSSLPSVTNVEFTSIDESYVETDVVYLSVTFSEAVVVTGIPRVKLNAAVGSYAIYDSGTTTDTLVFKYTVANNDTSSDLDYDATNSLGLNSGTIKDSAGNDATLTLPAVGTLAGAHAIVIDTVEPYVEEIYFNSNDGIYALAEVVEIKVRFSENVDVVVTGIPRIQLETGANDRYALYVSGSGTDTLLFGYTVQAGDSSLDLDNLSTTSFEFNSGTIKDAATNAADLTLPTVDTLATNGNVMVNSTSNFFISTWRTTNTSAGSSAANQVTLPLVVAGVYNFYVDWGDNSISYVNAWNDVDKTHTYSATGDYTIKMVGSYSQFIFANAGDRQKILSVSKWGANTWATFYQAFQGCTNVRITATDAPNLSGVTTLQEMFYGASSLANEDFSGWNTSTITNMQYLFYNATSFNGSVEAWDTSNVTNMLGTFSNAAQFNRPIGSWDTSSVLSMSGTFFGATNFNQPLNTWDVSSVTIMLNMFRSAPSFNQDLSSWNTSQVTVTAYMFAQANAFNGNINTWNTGNVTDMSAMFNGAVAFNQNIGGWNTIKVINFSSMFYGATAFNQDISTWNTAVATNMSYMFTNAVNFNQNISTWNTGAVTNMTAMFYGCSAFNQPIGSWNTANVLSMAQMFNFATTFNQSLATWNTAKVTNMSSMFNGATAFNGNITAWNTGLVTDMSSMFFNAINFNQNISGWNTANVVNMSAMFYNASVFNQPIGTWNITKVTNMISTLRGAIAFNQDLSGWSPIAVVNMAYMFASATSFNGNITNWNTTSVTNMQAMFVQATNFNQNISGWVTDNVTDMALMFQSATSFNQDISGWDTGLVTTMASMFYGATLFNQDLSGWDVSSVVSYANFAYSTPAWVLPQPVF